MALLVGSSFRTIPNEKRSADTTEVTFSIDYSLKFDLLGWLLDAVMMKRIFRKAFGVALEGLCDQLETGEIVTDSIPA